MGRHSGGLHAPAPARCHRGRLHAAGETKESTQLSWPTLTYPSPLPATHRPVPLPLPHPPHAVPQPQGGAVDGGGGGQPGWGRHHPAGRAAAAGHRPSYERAHGHMGALGRHQLPGAAQGLHVRPANVGRDLRFPARHDGLPLPPTRATRPHPQPTTAPCTPPAPPPPCLQRKCDAYLAAQREARWDKGVEDFRSIDNGELRVGVMGLGEHCSCCSVPKQHTSGIAPPACPPACLPACLPAALGKRPPRSDGRHGPGRAAGCGFPLRCAALCFHLPPPCCAVLCCAMLCCAVLLSPPSHQPTCPSLAYSQTQA